VSCHHDINDRPTSQVRTSLDEGMPLHMELSVEVNDHMHALSFHHNIHGSPFNVRLVSAQNGRAMAMAMAEVDRWRGVQAFPRSRVQSVMSIDNNNNNSGPMIASPPMRPGLKSPAEAYQELSLHSVGQSPQNGVNAPASTQQQQQAAPVYVPAPVPVAAQVPVPVQHSSSSSSSYLPIFAAPQQQQQQQQQTSTGAAGATAAVAATASTTSRAPPAQSEAQESPNPYAGLIGAVGGNSSSSNMAPTVQVETKHGDTGNHKNNIGVSRDDVSQANAGKARGVSSPAAAAVAEGRGLFSQHVAGGAGNEDADGWLPHNGEHSLVKESLEERALMIEQERDMLVVSFLLLLCVV
jgi:hypothetical protein